MSFQIGAITLPIVPFRASVELPTSRIDGEFPGTLPLIVSKGFKAKPLVIEGYLYSAALTRAQLLSTYITPLEALVHTVVVLVTPDGVHDGTWLFDSFKYDSSKDFPLAFKYIMSFAKGSDYMVLPEYGVI